MFKEIICIAFDDSCVRVSLKAHPGSTCQQPLYVINDESISLHSNQIYHVTPRALSRGHAVGLQAYGSLTCCLMDYYTF